MPANPQLFLRINLLRKFLAQSGKLKNNILQELVTHATDPVIRMRRFRMLSQLSLYESQIIKKIENLQTDNPEDFVSSEQLLNSDMHLVIDKSA
jgi:hypothetical protein